MTSIKYFILGNFLLFGFIAFPLSIFSAPIIQGPVVPAMYWKTSGGGNIFYTGGNIGIGKNNPTYLLDINGIINYIGFRMTTGASNNYILASDASGNARWTSTGSLFSSYVETDPLVSAWAKAPTKPSYNFTEITGTVTDAQVPDTVTINNATTASFANILNAPDGDRNAATKLPTTTPQGVRFDFVNAGTANGGGNYAGLMTYAPWVGSTASTGDASYQLAFNSTATNGGGIPYLSLRKGIDSTWNSWYTLLHSGNYNSYTPTLTGVGASGTWGINVTGNAGSVTNGVYTTGDQTISGNKTFNNDITVVGKVITDTLVNRTVAQLTVSGSILPNATSSQKDIGATGNRWANLWLSGNADITGSVTAGSFVGPLTGNASTATNADTVDGYHASNLVIQNTAQAPYGLATNSVNSAYSSAIQIRESNFGGAGAGTINEAPHLAFHWGGRVASQITMPSDGSIQIRNNPGTGYETLKAGAIYSNDNLVVTTNDARLSDSRVASDVSAWAKAPTKPSYNFTEIVGTVTDAQVPDTITINTAASANAVSFNGGLTTTSSPTFNSAVITTSIQAQSFNYPSDRNLKKNIIPIDSALNKILQLSGYSFNWKSDNTESIGVIAQEVESVFPEIVHTNPITGKKSVEYGNLVAPLIEAMKEVVSENKKLREKLDFQTHEISILKNENKIILDRLNLLEKNSKTYE